MGNLSFYIGIVLFTMSLIGSIFTGALGKDNAKDGMINGGILSFVILLLTSFMIGIILLAFMGIGSLIIRCPWFKCIIRCHNKLNNIHNKDSMYLISYYFIVEFIVGIIANFCCWYAWWNIWSIFKRSIELVDFVGV